MRSLRIEQFGAVSSFPEERGSVLANRMTGSLRAVQGRSWEHCWLTGQDAIVPRNRKGMEIVAPFQDDGELDGTASPVASDRHRRLLAETDRAYAALRADPDAWREELAERAMWDATLLDGLDEIEA